MSDKPINVLFLCTHNSARSILAEAVLNRIGNGRFKALSAGSSPRANQQPNPFSLKALEKVGIPTDGLRSKSWDEFGQPDAPPQASTAPSGGSALHEVNSVGVIFDLVITVCDNAANEVCPYWPGQPATAHWGYPDPSLVDGTDAQKLEAFMNTLHHMKRRMELLVSLPEASVSKLMLQDAARGLAKS